MGAQLEAMRKAGIVSMRVDAKIHGSIPKPRQFAERLAMRDLPATDVDCKTDPLGQVFASAHGSPSHVQIAPSVRNGSGVGGGAGGVAVLFARRDSIYKDLGADVYDEARDARSFPGGKPLVAHPPCRAFGRLRHMAKPAPGEKELAYWAVAQVRQWGGVLEHPQASLLWREMNLPMPGKGRDEFGGFALSVLQKWWGHRADKATWLYVCGCELKDVPQMPINLHESRFVVTSSLYRLGHPRWKPHLRKEEREQTPVEFASWLLLLAGRAAGAGVGRYAPTTEAKENEKVSDAP